MSRTRHARVELSGSKIAGVRRLAPEVAALGISLMFELVVLGGFAVAATSGFLPAGFGNRLLENQGTSTVTVAPSGVGPASSVTLADLDAVARSVTGAPATSRVVSSKSTGFGADAAPRAIVEGVDPSFLRTAGASITQGAFFTDQDAAAASRVAVLGHSVAVSLFADQHAVIGTTLRIRNLPFTVVGVLAAGADTDNRVLVPFQTGQVRLFGTEAVYQLVLQARDASQARLIADQAQQVLQQRHHVVSGRAPDFTVRTASDSPASPSLQAALRALQLTEQYSCRAKTLCAQSGPTS